MIVTPPIYTPVHQEEISRDGTYVTISEETVRKMVRNSNWLIDLVPLGTVIFIDINRFGTSIPNPSVFQECNGSEIVNPSSPLRTIGINQNFVPDYRDRYLKISPDNTNVLAGSNLHDLEHTHAAGMPSATGQVIKDKGDRRKRVDHTHDVAVQYANDTEILAPKFLHLVAYMRII